MKSDLMDKLLSESNSFKFYKENYQKLKDENKKIKEENRKLKRKYTKLQITHLDLKKQFWKDSKLQIYEKLKNGDYSNINISIKTPNPTGHHHWGDYIYALSLKKSLDKLGFNVSVHERNDWYGHDDEEIVIVLRGIKNYNINYEAINVMWNISHPDDITMAEYEKYDIVFVASERHAREIKKDLKTMVRPLLQCCDPEVFYPKENDNLRDNEILFVGSSRGVYRDVIEKISKTGHEFSVYGLGWEDFLDEEYLKDDFIPNDNLNQYYSSCKILLNDHWKDMRELGFISNRLFDALACGAFIISDKMQEVDTLFEGNVVTYASQEDLDEKIQYYLAHDDERNDKAMKGRQLVLANHTFDNRAEDIIESLKSLEF